MGIQNVLTLDRFTDGHRWRKSSRTCSPSRDLADRGAPALRPGGAEDPLLREGGPGKDEPRLRGHAGGVRPWTNDRVTNIVLGGLGGQGVLTASDILADAAFRAGFDVKKSELHGMSQRGGSVSSDVRYGPRVLQPMVPAGEADFLLVLEPTQVEVNRPVLKPGGRADPARRDPRGHGLKNKKSFNVAMLGALVRLAGHSRVRLAGCHPRPPGRQAAPPQRRGLRPGPHGRRRLSSPFPKGGARGIWRRDPMTAVKSPPASL
jgi:indolepyruvate ferredoxin oxidoreductase beta subunit